MVGMLRRFRLIFLLVASGFFITATGGCTTGPLKIEEVYYLSATNGEDTNYFRITVKANTQLGVAEFREGWFPASAVDALFGDVSEEGAAKASLVRETLRKQFDEAILETHRQYQAAAANPDTTPDQLRKLLAAQARIRLLPYAPAYQLPNTLVVQYDPSKGLVYLRSDAKLVWVLSSNPDDVIGSIANFSEQEATEKTVLKFTDVIVQSRRNEVVTRRATNVVGAKDDKLISSQIETALSALNANPTRPVALEHVEALTQLLLALRGGL